MRLSTQTRPLDVKLRSKWVLPLHLLIFARTGYMPTETMNYRMPLVFGLLILLGPGLVSRTKVWSGLFTV